MTLETTSRCRPSEAETRHELECPRPAGPEDAAWGHVERLAKVRALHIPLEASVVRICDSKDVDVVKDVEGLPADVRVVALLPCETLHEAEVQSKERVPEIQLGVHRTDQSVRRIFRAARVNGRVVSAAAESVRPTEACGTDVG